MHFGAIVKLLFKLLGWYVGVAPRFFTGSGAILIMALCGCSHGSRTFTAAGMFPSPVDPPRTNITLEWNCEMPGLTNWITGVAAAPSPLGPWHEVTNLPYAGTNRVTLPISRGSEFYRAFNRIGP